jgi:ribosomal-protein-alanine N-acetyltransferase
MWYMKRKRPDKDPKAGPSSDMSKDLQWFLRTDRLGFRHWSEADLELAVGLWGDVEVTKHFDRRGPLSTGQVQSRLSREIATQASHHVQYWPVFLIASGEHVGCAGLRPHDLPEKIYEIGFHIRSTLWGRGYAFEAANAVIAYAFDALDVNGLFAGHHPQNKASRHLILKLGFRYSHDAFYEPTGLHHPSYRLTADAYARRRS